MSKPVFSRAEVLTTLEYLDRYPANAMYREAALIIRQQQLEIEALESECEMRIQAALRHVEGTQQ